MIPGPSRLERRIARRTARRLERLRRRWPGAAPLLVRARATLREMSPAARRRFLYGPDLRGFLGEAEIWLEILERAGTAGRPGDRERKGRALQALFVRTARAEHPSPPLPAGPLNPGLTGPPPCFPARRQSTR